MSFLSNQETWARWAVETGAFSLILSLVIFLFVLALRARLKRREKKEKRFLNLWRPFFTEALLSGVKPLPPLAPEDTLPFLHLWNHLQESLRGPAKEKLNHLARLAKIDERALEILHRGKMREALLAIWALGHLREKKAWAFLNRLSTHPRAYLSLAAARGLLRIDPEQAVFLIAPLIVLRKDWPPARVVGMLKEVELKIVDAPMAHAALSAPAEAVPRLMGLMEALHCPSAKSTARRLLKTSLNHEIVSCCLNLLDEPQDLETLRLHLRHPAWFVRLKAAKALKKIGTEEDVPALTALLLDDHWWVRYRAAQSLCRLPFLDADRLNRILDEQINPLSKNILRHAMAEKEAA